MKVGPLLTFLVQFFGGLSSPNNMLLSETALNCLGSKTLYMFNQFKHVLNQTR